jgi:hypothetical protein
MLLRGRPGLQLPADGHTGEEFTFILKGWLFDDRGAYGPGDFDEAGDDIDHCRWSRHGMHLSRSARRGYAAPQPAWPVAASACRVLNRYRNASG